MSVPHSTPDITRWCALFIAITLLVPTSLSVVTIIKAEVSGTALYSSTPRLPATEQVTRNSSPDKFQEAISVECLRALLFGSLTFISFYFFKRLGE